MSLSKATRTRWLFAGLAALVGLGSFAAWRAQPSPAPSPPSVASARPQAPSTAQSEAFVEIAVASPLDEQALAAWEDRRKLESLLGTFAPRAPGDAGLFHDAAVAMIRDERRLGVEVMSTERYILPAEADGELIAAQLSPAERARFFASKSVLVLRVRGAGGAPHWTARAGFGLAAALAEQVEGLLDDPVRRRVETPALVKARMPPIEMRSAFSDDAIAVEFDPDDGTAERGRVLTLGMRRFGAPDFELTEIAREDSAAAARALTGLCRIAAARTLKPESTLAPAEWFAQHRRQGADFSVRFTPGAMATGNPENDFWQVGLDAATRARVLREFSLVDLPDAGLHAETDVEFAIRLRAVRAGLPALLARWQKESGTLQVLVDFAAAGDGIEAMWVNVETLDTNNLHGTLANEPAHVLALHHGSVVDVRDPVISGVRLVLASGERVALP